MNATAIPFCLMLPFVLLGTGLATSQPNAAQTSGAVNEEKLQPRQKALYRSARLAAEWLFQANVADGRFRTGVNPVLNMPLPDEGFLPQAEAALALARASRLFGEERFAVRAKQALLTLLAQTKTDPQNANLRHTTLPPAALNRAAAAALMVLAVQELPEPGKDLLDQSEQLANFLRTLQQADGSFLLGEQAAPQSHQSAEAAAQQHLAAHGSIVAALMRSHMRSPAAWKLEATQKAHAFYRSRWQANKQLAPTPGLMLAFADAYRLTKEKPYADTVLEMADWLVSLQLPADPQQPMWEGGFADWKDGKPVVKPPTAADGCMIEALAAGLQTARLAGDLARFERCRNGMERGGQFLVTHQYTPANVNHYADWFQKGLIGSYFISAEQGANPLSATARCCRALAACLPAFADDGR